MREHERRLQKQIASIKGDLAILEEARTELLAALAEQPDNAEITEQLDKLEQADIKTRQNQVARLESMLKAAAAIDEKALQAAEEQRKREAHDRHVTLLEERAAAAEQLVEAWPKVLDLLTEIKQLSIDARAAGLEAGLFRVQDSSDRFMEGAGHLIARSLMQTGVGGALGPQVRLLANPLANGWLPINEAAKAQADRARERRDAMRGGDRHAQ